MVKAIFFDIDGTLLSFKTNAVPESTKEAFKRLRKDGVKLFIATGRPLKDIKNLDGLSFDGYVTMNGAYCVDEAHKLIYKETIPGADVDALFSYQKEKTRFPWVMVTREYSVINYIDEAVQSLSRMVDVPLPKNTDLREVPQEEILQMSIFIKEKSEQQIMSDVLVNCQASRWHPTFADINKKGVSKQSGIDYMLNHFDLALSDTMAFGDGGNDIPMLKHVPMSVAMGNAEHKVQQTADYITDSVDDDGLWNALQKYVWNA